MRTFTLENCGDEPGTIPPELEERLAEALATEDDNDGILKRVLEAMRPFFPVEYTLLSYSSPAKQQSRYYVYPAISDKRKDYRFIATREQRFLFNMASPCVVHIGNEMDYSISLGLIRQLFPHTRFSMIMFRTVNSRNVVCGFSLIVCRENCYTRRHAGVLLAARDIFCRFFEKQEPQMKEADIPFKRNVLPLALLPGLKEVYENILAIARHDCPVLLLGETGTGKEIVADTIYRTSARVYGPFIKINCGCIPENLVDSELFGHEKGAFTGAAKTTKGCFEQASQGMLMLDEVGELSLASQVRLLRVLQEGRIRRVGDFTPIDVDVRVIAATHRSLPEMVASGTFREDLFYRLNVFPLYIPPLRERLEDIRPLVSYFISSRCEASGWDIPSISRDNMEELLAWTWPGNVRELQNAVERALICWNGGAGGRRFRIVFGNALLHAPVKVGAERVVSKVHTTPDMPFEPLETVIGAHIRRALEKSGGRVHGKGGAAELLGMNPSTLRSRMKKLGIDAGREIR